MAELNDSILDSIKKMLGLDPEYTAFDSDIVMHINSVFFTLQQLGLGPVQGFMITDKETKWTEYAEVEQNINAIKSYMYLKVRLLFDPPATSFALESMNKQLTEFEWRLNVQAEGAKNPWVNPNTLTTILHTTE